MHGVFTALITPFKKDLSIDLEAYKKILHDQKDAQITGVIPCGTTGETPSLTVEEKKLLIKTALEELKDTELKVIAGTGTNNTEETIAFSKWADDQGVDAILVVTPYYNKPSQAGLEAHFKAVADAVSCEVILYNVPGRTGVSLAAPTIAKLAQHERIRSLKEATGNVAFTSEVIDALGEADLDILSGDDATYLPLLSVGAVGVISVASNLFPRAMVALQKAAHSGDYAQARTIHQKYYPLFRDLFVESNPVPIKYAMAKIGLGDATVRKPLAPLAKASIQTLEASLEHCGIRSGSRL